MEKLTPKFKSPMEKLTPRSESIAKAFAAPLILRILKPVSATQLSENIKNHVNIVTSLKENPAVLKHLKFIISTVPFASAAIIKALPNIRSKPWLRWFINNELAHKRPDLHAIFIYHPKAYGWLYRNMISLSKYLIEQLS